MHPPGRGAPGDVHRGIHHTGLSADSGEPYYLAQMLVCCGLNVCRVPGCHLHRMQKPWHFILSTLVIHTHNF